MSSKKIRVVGFATGDVSRSHSVVIGLGFVAALAGMFGVGFGAFSRSSLTDITSAVEASRLATAGVERAVSTGAMGELKALPATLTNVGQTLSSVNPMWLPSADSRQALAQMAVAWNDLGITAAPMERAVTGSTTLHKQLIGEYQRIAQVSARIEPYRGSPAGSAAFESVSRIIGYTSSGFGFEAGARISYDLSNLAYQLRTQEGSFGPSARETRQIVDQVVQATVGLANQIKSDTPNSKDIAALGEKSRLAAGAADNLLAVAASGLQAAMIILIGGAVAAVAGLLMVLSGVVLAVSEYGSRFRKALSQFNKGEGAMVRLEADAKAIAGGKLGVTADTSDEGTSLIAESLNQITAQTRDVISKASSFASETETGARDMGDHAARNEEEAKALLAILNDTLSSMHSMSNGFEWLSHDSKAVAYAARQTLESLSAGQRAVQDSVERMDAIRDAMQDTGKRTKRLGERSQEVGEILEDLRAMAEQINVLAMNASLEAERAGEGGKGFRVVAAEVRNLSTRVDAALNKASGAVDAMQGDARSAIESMERSIQKVAAGAYVGEIAAATIQMSRSGVESVASMSTVISNGAAEDGSAASIGAEKAEAGAGTMSRFVEWIASVKKSCAMTEASSLNVRRSVENAYK